MEYQREYNTFDSCWNFCVLHGRIRVACRTDETRLFYLQTIESCGIYNKRTMSWEAGRGFMGGSSRIAPCDPPQRILRAPDISNAKVAWELPQVGSGESRSCTLATASGLVFFGEDSGALMAADSRSGSYSGAFRRANRFAPHQ